MSEDTCTMIFSVLEHLASIESDHPSETRAHLRAAIDGLETAFDISLGDPKQVRDFSLEPASFPSIFEAGVQSLGAKSAAQQLAELEASEAFGQFVKVVSSKGYFKGVEKGSTEYDERMSKLVAKFKARTQAASGGPPVEEAGTAAGATPRSSGSPPEGEAVPLSGAKAVDEKKAEEVKGRGNKLLLEKNYEGAEECYTEALELSRDGPNSHVYLCNRAAALCYLGRLDDAVVDCQEAIDLNPSYAKAYTRLGYAYFQLEDYEASAKAYKKSLEIEPGNAANTKSLRKAMSKLGRDATDELSTDQKSGMPDLSSLAAMMGGGAGGPEAGAGGLAGMLNNPDMMARAQQMMQNPAMMAQLQQMMQNPAMMQGLMGMMGGGGAGGSGGGPDLSALASMMGGGGAGGAGGMGGGSGSGGKKGENR